MPPYSFTDQLEKYGPGRKGDILDLEQAEQYCQKLARRHYENFTVASWLLPRRLRKHFANIYSYCRWADDLSDEVDDPQESLRLLEWWEDQLQACYAGETEHPVFIALHETIHQFEIPRQSFLDLLVAFRQDQQSQRYNTFEELLDYCRYSANPVGRLVLYLGGVSTPQALEYSDSICTGLQLANFWQDVSRDLAQNRIYLPTESLNRFGYDEAVLQQRVYNQAFRDLLKYEVDRAEKYLTAGFPLIHLVPADLQFDIELFIRGGLSILQAIRKLDYDVWSRRPTVNKKEKLLLLLSIWWHGRKRILFGDGS